VTLKLFCVTSRSFLLTYLLTLDCLGLVSENFWDASSRSRKVLVNVSSRSRLGCNVKRLGLGPKGLVHIPGYNTSGVSAHEYSGVAVRISFLASVEPEIYHAFKFFSLVLFTTSGFELPCWLTGEW